MPTAARRCTEPCERAGDGQPRSTERRPDVAQHEQPVDAHCARISRIAAQRHRLAVERLDQPAAHTRCAIAQGQGTHTSGVSGTGAPSTTEERVGRKKKRRRQRRQRRQRPRVCAASKRRSNMVHSRTSAGVMQHDRATEDRQPHGHACRGSGVQRHSTDEREAAHSRVHACDAARVRRVCERLPRVSCAGREVVGTRCGAREACHA
jgi:hypothetical protein